MTDSTAFNLRGLLHTQGVQGNLESFQIIKNLRETQDILIFFKLRETQGSFFFWKFQGSVKIKKKSQGKYFQDLEWELVNPISIFCLKKMFYFYF